MSDVRMYDGVEVHTGTCLNCGKDLTQWVGMYRDGTKGNGGQVKHTNPYGRGDYQCSLFARGELTLDHIFWIDGLDAHTEESN